MGALSVEEVAMEALALPSNDRAELAHRLITSLYDDRDPEAGKLWMEEIRRRNAEIDQNLVEGIPADEVFREIRSQMRR